MRPDYCPIGGEPCQSVCAEPCSVAKKATPHETLIAQLMDSRVLKTEREHAAAREIERLRGGAAPEPAAWINFNAATGECSVSFKSESEFASIPLWREPPRAQRKPSLSQKLHDAGYTRRPSLKAMEMREALELIAAPPRPDGTWNRDREACRQIASEALGRYDDE